MKKRDKFLSILLTLVMIAGMIPASAIPARAASYSDPSYNRFAAPESVIFNAYTGANQKFFTSHMEDKAFNAVEQGKFKSGSNKTLKYSATVSSTESYRWSGFKSSNLAALQNEAHQLRAGYAVTRTSNSHYHRFWRGVMYYQSDMTSFINAEFQHGYAYGIQSWKNYDKNGSKISYGTASFGLLPKEITSDLNLEFSNSVLFYDNYEEKCTCGGSAKNHMVSFFDETAPELTAVDVVDENGEKKTTFGQGDTVYIRLKCSEPVRFADDSASGKGEVYIRLVVEGASEDNWIKARLVSLNKDTLVFGYDVPRNLKGLVVITGIDIGAASNTAANLQNNNRAALVHQKADIDLLQLYTGGTVRANAPDGVDKKGFSLTTSYITDMAGNALTTPSYPIPRKCYIDCEGPYVAKASIDASPLNYAIKNQLGKTDKNAEGYYDASDTYLGVGDFFSTALYLNEVVAEGAPSSVVVTTNVKRSGGDYVALTAWIEGETSASRVGTQYGLGESNGYVSFLRSDSIRITEDMSVEDTDGIIRIKNVDLSGLKDLGGNSYDGSKTVTTNEAYKLDTAAPTVEMGAVVQQGGVNQPFYIPIRIIDTLSGAEGLSATAVLGSGGDVTPYEYTVTDSVSAPNESEWKTSRTGVGHADFIVKGTAAVPKTQYLHVRRAEDGKYNYSNKSDNLHQFDLKIYTTDYAGNRKNNYLGTLQGDYAMDSIAPNVRATGRSEAYDSTTSKGTLTVNLSASDSGSGLASVKYQWLASGTDLPAPDAWQDAVGSLDGNPLSAPMTASSAPIAKGESFTGRLYALVKDAAGNETERDLGIYSYNLGDVVYKLNYSDAVTNNASAVIEEISSGGRLFFDMELDGQHYIKLITQEGWTSNGGVINGQIFRGSGDFWYKATCGEDNGAKVFTPSDKVTDMDLVVDNFTGNLAVKIYSGTSAAILKNGALTNNKFYDTYAEGDKLTVTSAANEDSITLRISDISNTAWNYEDLYIKKLFTLVQKPATSENLKRGFKQGNSISGLPWTYDKGQKISSAIEGETVSFDLGEDVNGWNFADVDWENSELKLYNSQNQAEYRLCGIGAGPQQTITLPSVEGLESGEYTVRLYLKQHSGGTHEIRGDTIQLDLTEPGSLAFGLLTQNGEELAYDPNSTIYYSAAKGEASISVEALNAEGESWNYNDPEGCGVYAGAMDVVAWNTARPNDKLSLGYDYFVKDAEGDLENASNRDTGKRSLYFGDTTEKKEWYDSNSKATIAVTPNKDNVIALQIFYANGKESDIKYITVHPTRLDLEGAVSTNPAPQNGQKLVAAAPGKASVIFTPAAGSLVENETKVYCVEGYEATDGSFVPLDASAEPVLMTRQGDSFVMPVEDSGLTLPVENGKPRGFYYVYAVDKFANRKAIGITANAILIDSAAPVIKYADIYTGQKYMETPSGIIAYDGGEYSASFTIEDFSLFDDANHPITVSLSFAGEYAEQIGANGESLTVTLDPDVVEHADDDDDIEKGWNCEGHAYTWGLTEPNRMGITSITAYLERESSYNGDNVASFAGEKTKAALTVFVNGVISPKIKREDGIHIALNLIASDSFGYVSEPVSVTTENVAIGVEPEVISTAYNPTHDRTQTGNLFDYELRVSFNVPVQPAESWINRNISGYAEDWYESFPIWKNGRWQIEFSDVFGTRYVKELVIENNGSAPFYGFGPFGIELEFSTLDYVDAATGVVINASASAGRDSFENEITAEVIPSRIEAHENGDYELKRRWITSYTDEYGETIYTDRYDTLIIHINNIVSGAPKATLNFYFDEFKQLYAQGEQPRGKTNGSVTVSYRTDRETSPRSDTSATLKYGSDSFSFRYYDTATDKTYTLAGKLSDYGIILEKPTVEQADTEAPTIDIVTIWKQQGGSFEQMDAFSGSADEAAIKAAFDGAGSAQQSYQLLVNASDSSDWKLLVKNSAPSGVSFSSGSDSIPGVSVSGNTVLVTSEVKNDFYIVAVDNAKAQTKAGADNFSFIKIPCDGMSFDTVPPELLAKEKAVSFYEKYLFLKAADKNNKGEDKSASVSITGDGVELNPGRDPDFPADEYPCMVVLKRNGKVNITATDAAGNITTKGITVSGIDTDAPTLSVTWTPCFRDDAKTGAARYARDAAPTIPVNTDVVARITSNKPIEKISVDDTDYDFGGNTAIDMLWGKIDLTAQSVTVRFSQSAEVNIEVMAPNGRSTPVTLKLNAGVIDKTAPTVSDTHSPVCREGFSVPYEEKHVLSFDEAVYCLFPLKAEKDGSLIEYGAGKALEVVLTNNESQVFRFADKAGNSMEYVIMPLGTIDNTPPAISISVDDSSTNENASVTVTANEECTLSSSDAGVSCGAMSGSGDSWTGTVTVPKNGVFRITAYDAAGNAADAVVSVNNIDRVAPTISFASSTLIVRQDSDEAELRALLDEGVISWDNSELVEGSLSYDVSSVNLANPGVYTVSYSVRDAAGNTGRAERYVKVVDKNKPFVKIDDEVTEENGTTSISPGEHTLIVTGLKTPDEPFTVQLINGIRSVGQMKRVSDAFPVGADGKFTLNSAGFYTMLITTQSRQTYRILLYVEK